ncbi:MAG: endopeptidase La [Candidatus Hydrogenedentes bacterium]|nr:endopeptidase La [Candidatus Hydrogenedentota bacterium]
MDKKSNEDIEGPKLDTLPAPTSFHIPDTLPLLTLRDVIPFPSAMLPLRITSSSEKMLIEDCSKSHRLVALLTEKPETLKDGKETDKKVTFSIGCIGRILQVQPDPEGGLNVFIQAIKRFFSGGIMRESPYPVVKVLLLEEPKHDPKEIEPIMLAIKNQTDEILKNTPNVPEEARLFIQNIEDPVFLTAVVATNLRLKVEERQEILEMPDLKSRMLKLVEKLQYQLELVRASSKIREDVQKTIEKSQKEYFLRQQLKAIQKELGEVEGVEQEVKEYKEKIENLKASEETKKELLKEVNRLSRMNEHSPEYHVIISYLDTVLDLPWGIFTEDRLDLQEAEKILNEDHYGLEKVKKRILEYLAVRKLKPNAHGPILCFQGPPGVGKTSLGHSIARALGRKFIRVALGGVHDEAEIRGHRKTYIGAMPGRIMMGIRKVGSQNPVFMLDEIDKLGSDFRGDPSSALLEVLDPEQNHSFVDNYINVPFDLSKVLFIATANELDPIPWALRDRLEVLHLPGYTLEEKIEIAKRYLIPKQIREHGLTSKNIVIKKDALAKIITSYTRESGVRNLEREIANICRGVARKIANNEIVKEVIAKTNLKDYLGPERIYEDFVTRTKIPGVAIGLAWTPTGGDILFIESTSMPGKGNLILTGQLGDVMKESAQIALSYVRSCAKKLSITEETLFKEDIHIHVPAGATPKDGPSAGITILTSLVSLLTKRCVPHNLAMTGEITLRGNILAVGGIKEKILAASRAGIKKVILPERNKNDLEEIPKDILKKMNIYLVSTISEAIKIALKINL